ncbi:FAD binding domain-containing protein [Colletotrichum acutatum]|uniref:FAD binding domain-containing protein n=1 Tax=Glomerella acutata TaxID=27357 RepID=A0AAD8UUI5_GLOAC|nr:FAD binding domain-containing protein [Colletotrichum acutatum]KAK1726535.1 FAD binding domain-containing protein [Colletotrichum acutatum]
MGIKIIIVGGSVAGLSLANMLERFDIDYTILEAVTFRDANGKPISSTPGPTMSERMEKHAGYASLWVDRQMLLQILYDNLRQKQKVLTNKRVVDVETTSTGVAVTTEDGSTHTGDILVGGDGVHSKVREEMWRIASVSDPIAFPQEERSIVQSSMKCIFGISKQPVNFPPGATQESTFFRGHLYLVISAPGGRVYWFLFHELGETKYGKDIPKFSKEDELLLSTQHREDHITEDMTFGDLYDNRIKSTLVPLEEHVFRRWHFQRILIIGDAATKVLPQPMDPGLHILQKCLVVLMLPSRSIRSQLKEETALSEVCAIRYERAFSMMKKGRRDGAFLCQQQPFSGLMIHYVLPWLGDNLFFKELLKQSLAGPHIEKLPVPERPHTTPYNDELPQISSRYYLFGWTTGTLLVVSLGIQSAGRFAWVVKSR